MMLIEPGDVHATLAVSVPSDFDVVRFAPGVFERAMSELDRAGRFHFRAPSGENPAVALAMTELVRAHAHGEQGLSIEAHEAELVRTVVDELSEAPGRSAKRLHPVRDFRLRRAAEYLRANLRSKPSLDELAAELRVSKYTLCASFKAAFGTSIGYYWMSARVAEACRRLLQGVPIKLVSSDLGFTDEAFFTRMFRRHRGVPPGAWLRIQRKNSTRPRGRPLVRSA